MWFANILPMLLAITCPSLSSTAASTRIIELVREVPSLPPSAPSRLGREAQQQVHKMLKRKTNKATQGGQAETQSGQAETQGHQAEAQGMADEASIATPDGSLTSGKEDQELLGQKAAASAQDAQQQSQQPPPVSGKHHGKHHHGKHHHGHHHHHHHGDQPPIPGMHGAHPGLHGLPLMKEGTLIRAIPIGYSCIPYHADDHENHLASMERLQAKKEKGKSKGGGKSMEGGKNAEKHAEEISGGGAGASTGAGASSEAGALTGAGTGIQSYGGYAGVSSSGGGVSSSSSTSTGPDDKTVTIQTGADKSSEGKSDKQVSLKTSGSKGVAKHGSGVKSRRRRRDEDDDDDDEEEDQVAAEVDDDDEEADPLEEIVEKKPVPVKDTKKLKVDQDPDSLKEIAEKKPIPVKDTKKLKVDEEPDSLEEVNEKKPIPVKDTKKLKVDEEPDSLEEITKKKPIPVKDTKKLKVDEEPDSLEEIAKKKPIPVKDTKKLKVDEEPDSLEEIAEKKPIPVKDTMKLKVDEEPDSLAEIEKKKPIPVKDTKKLKVAKGKGAKGKPGIIKSKLGMSEYLGDEVSNVPEVSSPVKAKSIKSKDSSGTVEPQGKHHRKNKHGEKVLHPALAAPAEASKEGDLDLPVDKKAVKVTGTDRKEGKSAPPKKHQVKAAAPQDADKPNEAEDVVPPSTNTSLTSGTHKHRPKFSQEDAPKKTHSRVHKPSKPLTQLNAAAEIKDGQPEELGVQPAASRKHHSKATLPQDPILEAPQKVATAELDSPVTGTQSHAAESKSGSQSHFAQPKPGTQSHLAEPKPVVHSHSTEPKPVVHSQSAELKPVVHSHSAQMKSGTKSHSAEPKPGAQSHSAEPKPGAQSHSAEPKPGAQSHSAKPKPRVHSHSAEPTPEVPAAQHAVINASETQVEPEPHSASVSAKKVAKVPPHSAAGPSKPPSEDSSTEATGQQQPAVVQPETQDISAQEQFDVEHEVMNFPSHPPFHVTELIMRDLRYCFSKIPQDTWNGCCLGIADAFTSLLGNKLWPKVYVLPESCNLFCLKDVVSKICTPYAEDSIAKLAYGVLAHYSRLPALKVPQEIKFKNYVNAIVLPAGPPYKITDQIIEGIKRCFLPSLLVYYEYCCKTITQVIQAILTDKPLPDIPIKVDQCNIFCIEEMAGSRCTVNVQSAFLKLSYAIIMRYNMVKRQTKARPPVIVLPPFCAYGFISEPMRLPDAPPYKLHHDMLSNLRLCFKQIDASMYEACCPGISFAYEGLLQNKAWLKQKMDPDHCDLVCLDELVYLFCTPQAVPDLRTINYAILLHYNKDNVKVLPPSFGLMTGILHLGDSPPYSMPVYIRQPVGKCQVGYKIDLKVFDQCCQGINDIIGAILANKEWPDVNIAVTNCNILCVAAMSSKFCGPKAEPAYLQLVYAILLHYNKGSLLPHESEPQKTKTEGDSSDVKPEEFKIAHKPPYRVPVVIVDFIKRCVTSNLVHLYDECCAGIVHVIQALLKGIPMPKKKIQIQKCNIYCIQDLAVNQCSKESEAPSLQLVYAVLMYYGSYRPPGPYPYESIHSNTAPSSQSRTENKYYPYPPVLPPQKPDSNDASSSPQQSGTLLETLQHQAHALSGLMQNDIPGAVHILPQLRKCLKKTTFHLHEKCCPNIVAVFLALIDNHPWPTQRVSVLKCNILCVYGVTGAYCLPEVPLSMFQLTYAIVLHYLQPGITKYYVLPPDSPPYNVPENILSSTQRCFVPTVFPHLEKCCRGVTARYQAIFNENPLPRKSISIKNCNTVCIYEAVATECSEEAVSPVFQLTFAILFHYMKLIERARHAVKYPEHVLDPERGTGQAIKPKPAVVPEPNSATKRLHVMKVLPGNPPYNLQDKVLAHLKKCLKNDLLPHYEKCCPNITPIFQAIAKNKPLPEVKLTIMHCNLLCVHGVAVSFCSQDLQPIFLQITYAGILRHWNPEMTQYYVLPPDPPFTLPENIMVYLEKCLVKSIKGLFDKCCPGIAACFQAILKNMPLPETELSLKDCKTLCIYELVVKKCTEMALLPFFQLTYAVIVHYLKMEFLKSTPILVSNFQEKSLPNESDELLLQKEAPTPPVELLKSTPILVSNFEEESAPSESEQDEDIPGEGGDAPAAVFVLPQQPPYELPNQMTTHIKSCMTKDILPHYETCCPHITPVLESLIADQPMPLKVRLTPLTCNILCVHGVSTHYCSRDVTETFMKITYAAILSYIKPDVRDYFLIPPQPPYNVPDLLTNVVNECTSKLQEQFEKCCSGISHVIQCIIDSKPLPPHFLSFKTCNTICMSMAVKTKCKEEDMSPFFELIYSILFHYHQNNRYEDSLFVLPRQPPYQLPEDMNIHIRTCMKRTIVPHFEKCCPHITPVYECILTNQPIPTQYKITPFTCNILCVHGVSIIYCSPEASGTILKITFGAILFYTRPATKQYYVIPPHPPYHIPSKMLTVLQDCTIRIHDKFEKCCRGISQVIQFLVDEKPLPPHVISFKDCNTVCLSETVQQLCKEEDVNPIFEFIYSIILHYFDNVKHDFTKAGLTSSGSDVQHSPDHMPGPVQPGDADEDPCCPYVKSLPPHPPYGFDETVIEKIKSCMTQEIKPHFDECCPNYSEVVQCIIDNQPLPNHDISPIICNYLCIYQVTTTHCNHPGKPAAFFQITYSIMMHYLQPELERLFVLFAHPPWKVENGIKSANKACLAEVRQKFDDCCSGMTQSIQNIIADKPLPLNLISFQHCNPICVYETVQKLCENGAIVPLFQLTYAIMYYYFSVTNKKQGANAEAEAEAEAIIPHVPTEPPEAEPREEFIDNKLPDEDAGAPCCEVFVFPSKPPFQLSEDMVKSIRQCLQRKIVPHYEKCCPHITPVYECLLTNKPMPPMQITALTCNFLCVLGVASTYCPEESHAVMFQVTYVTILRYMQPGMQQAFVLPKLPPWNLPETMINHLKKCTSTLKPKLEQCCKGITQVYQSIIDGQPLQSHIISFKQCNSVCICSLVEKQCSKDAVLTFFQVTYAACYYYFTQMSRSRIPVPSNFQETGEPSPTTDIIAGFILPSSPPYELPSQMLQNLKSCINSDTTPHLEICCPSITQVYKSLMDNEPFPLDSPLDVFNCNFLCVHGVIQGQCPQTETQMMFMKTTYAAILIYMQPGVKEYLVLPPAPPWNIPDNFMEFIKKCSTTLSTRFEQCCSGISVCIQAIMSEKPLPPNVISFRSCNLICVYQVVEQQCNPEAVLPFFHVTYAIIYHFLSMTISDPGGGGAPQIANTMTRPDTLPETQGFGER